jgi:glycosyltransferase involved in cell wall biosynthesis
LYAPGKDEHEFAAKIVELLDDPEARERMGRIGRKRMESALDWRLQIPNLLAAYDKAMEVAWRRRARRAQVIARTKKPGGPQ